MNAAALNTAAAQAGQCADDLHVENGFLLGLIKSDPAARAKFRRSLPKMSDENFERLVCGKVTGAELPALLGLVPKGKTP